MDPSPPAPTGRRRLSAQQRRAALVQATITVVSHVGFQRASLAQIAQTAGVSKGLIWHYFADGDDLMAHTARTTLVRLREAVAADLDLSAPVPTVIRAAISRAAQLPRTHAEEIAALVAIVSNLRSPDGSPALGISEYEETYTLQEVLFARGQREGSLRALDPRVIAVTYQSAIDTMLTYLRAHPEADPDTYAQALADLLLHGIAADPALAP